MVAGISHLAFDPGQHNLVAASATGLLMIWSLGKTMKVLGSRKLQLESNIISLSFHPRHALFFVLAAHGQLTSWTYLKAPKDANAIVAGTLSVNDLGSKEADTRLSDTVRRWHFQVKMRREALRSRLKQPFFFFFSLLTVIGSHRTYSLLHSHFRTPSDFGSIPSLTTSPSYSRYASSSHNTTALSKRKTTTQRSHDSRLLPNSRTSPLAVLSTSVSMPSTRSMRIASVRLRHPPRATICPGCQSPLTQSPSSTLPRCAPIPTRIPIMSSFIP